VVIKNVADYTGVVQFKHPHELGDYWTFNLFCTFLLLAFSAVFYSE
jgi:hypothetical protein